MIRYLSISLAAAFVLAPVRALCADEESAEEKARRAFYATVAIWETAVFERSLETYFRGGHPLASGVVIERAGGKVKVLTTGLDPELLQPGKLALEFWTDRGYEPDQYAPLVRSRTVIAAETVRDGGIVLTAADKPTEGDPRGTPSHIGLPDGVRAVELEDDPDWHDGSREDANAILVLNHSGWPEFTITGWMEEGKFVHNVDFMRGMLRRAGYPVFSAVKWRLIGIWSPARGEGSLIR